MGSDGTASMIFAQHTETSIFYCYQKTKPAARLGGKTRISHRLSTRREGHV